MPSNCYLVFLAIGAEQFKKEALASIASHGLASRLAKQQPYPIVVYTDEPRCFLDAEKFEIEVIPKMFTSTEYDEVKAQFDGYAYGVKICILRRFFESFGSKCIFVDSDTFFVAGIQQLVDTVGPSRYALHIRERNIRAPIFHHLSRIRRYANSSRARFNAKPYRMSKTSGFWNSGVIAIDEEQADLLDEVTFFTKLFHSKRAHHTSEQLAFSHVLENNGRIYPAEAFVAHYWFVRSFRFLLFLYFDIESDLSIVRTAFRDSLPDADIERLLSFIQAEPSLTELHSLLANLYRAIFRFRSGLTDQRLEDKINDRIRNWFEDGTVIGDFIRDPNCPGPL